MTALTPSDFNIASRASIFSGFKREMFQRVIESASVVRVAKRQVLYRQGEFATVIFIIIRGGIKLYQSTAAGDEAVIDILTKGESLPMADAFNGERHHVTAEAISTARVLRIPINQLVSCIREAPDVALAVMATTFQHFHRLMQQVAQLKTQTALQRLAGYVASLCSTRAGSCVVTLPYGKVLIAGQLGIKPESLSRAFASLKSVGVDVQNTRVKVHDVSRLRRFATKDQC